MTEEEMKVLAELQGLASRAKAGWRTSEFWLTVVGQIAGCVVMTYGMIKSNDMIVAVGGLLAGGAQAPYAIARALVKKSAP